MIYKFRHQGSTEPYICGCYFLEPIRGVRKYLPQVKLEAHSTIISSISRTTLTQTFVNPDATNTLTEIRYTFPLFDGVSVVGFVCTIGDRVIKGVVKEKQKAREAYDAAISRGETASLFERLPDASDVFTTTVGNVPAGATIEVNITYLGELKHDAHVDGIRLTIPTRIAPRYGDYPVELASATPTSSGGIKITVDAQVPDGSHITSIQSPSHPIAVTLGRTSVAPNAEPSFQKASATLALSTAELEKDFVLQLVATNIGNPKAILELHPSIPNQRALMATLVPKFTFPAEKPEIVFLCDRSGSMGHDNKIQNLQAALRLFVKSLSVGTKFNICSFGTKFDFLWDRSRTYEQSTVNQAMRHIDTFSANYGGTEMYEPMEETFKRRYTDMNLEVFLLTDGEIWQQDRLMNLVNDEVKASKDTIRVFTLGIGSAVSHSLIEGVARAGNGFSQSAAAGENLSSKVVRMLKGAMFPHIKDRSLELKYEKSPVHSEDFSNDDFEIIEKVAALEVSSTGVLTSPLAVQEESQKAPISLFDDSINPNTETGNASQNAEDHHSHLPPLKCPKILQAPFSIPPLFPFNRSTFYLLLSADTIQSTLKSVIIRGSSVHGPVELEIPITTLEEKGETIHQLATKKAVTDLEEGRGWIFHAKTTDGQLLKEKYDGQFSDMVEREGVRLGVQYQVGGKWCSFVAVDEKGNAAQHQSVLSEEALPVTTNLYATSGHGTRASSNGGTFFGAKRKMAQAPRVSCASGIRTANFDTESAKSALPGASPEASGNRIARTASMLRSFLQPQAQTQAQTQQQNAPSTRGGSLFGSAKLDVNLASLRRSEPHSATPTSGLLGGKTGLTSAGPCTESTTAYPEMASVHPGAPDTDLLAEYVPTDILQALTCLHHFEGYWELTAELEKLMKWDANSLFSTFSSDVRGQKALASVEPKNSFVATACVVAWLRRCKDDEKDAWELLVDKALLWLDSVSGGSGVSAEEAVTVASGTIAGL